MEQAGNPTPHGEGQAAFTLLRRRQFLWKTVLLAATTLALVPVLLYQSLLWATAWLITLIVVHVAGIAVLVYGTKRHHIAPDRRGLAYRLAGIVVLGALLAFVGEGLTRYPVGHAVFWGSLFAVWALHTLGLMLLHVRGRREMAVCPFA